MLRKVCILASALLCVLAGGWVDFVSAAEIPIARQWRSPVGNEHGDNWELNGGNGYLHWSVDGGAYHPGEDLNLITGGDTDCNEPAYAAATGTIVAADWFGPGWGNIVMIRSRLPNGDIVDHQYAHLTTMNVSEGQEVALRSQIGTVGKTGGYTHCHLHFEVRPTRLGAGFWPAGYTQSWVGDHYTHPRNFISDHWNLAPPEIPSYVYNIFARAEAAHSSYLGSRREGLNGQVHWYHGNGGDNDCLIQEFRRSDGVDTALILRTDGMPDAVPIGFGFYQYWTSQGGPASSLGIPLFQAYSQGTGEARQDFMKGYLYYKSGVGQSSHYYPFVAPGWFPDGWRGYASYQIARAYHMEGGRNTVGEAMPNGGSPAEVHNWDGVYIQDFNDGSFGGCAIIYNQATREAYLVRTGFWGHYIQNGGPSRYGAPRSSELTTPGKQSFDHGVMYWLNGQVYEVVFNTGYIGVAEVGKFTDIGERNYLSGDHRVSVIVDGVAQPDTEWTWDFSTASAFDDTEVLTGDIDGDGLDDICVLHREIGWVDCAPSLGDGFMPYPEVEVPPRYVDGPYGAFLIDLNDDGMKDVVLHSQSTGVFTRFLSQEDVFSGPQVIGPPVLHTGASYRYFVGDIDGDSREDLVIFLDAPDLPDGAGDNWVAFLNEFGDLSHDTGHSMRWAVSTSSSPKIPYAGDFDLNGVMDVGVLVRARGEWLVALNDEGIFYPLLEPWLLDAFDSDDVSSELAVLSGGDVTGDGLDDVVVYQYGNRVWNSLNSTGDGFVLNYIGQGQEPVTSTQSAIAEPLLETESTWGNVVIAYESDSFVNQYLHPWHRISPSSSRLSGRKPDKDGGKGGGNGGGNGNGGGGSTTDPNDPPPPPDPEPEPDPIPDRYMPFIGNFDGN